MVLPPICRMTNIKQYILSLDNIDTTKILSTWTWLVDNDKSVIALTKAGDAMIQCRLTFCSYKFVATFEAEMCRPALALNTKQTLASSHFTRHDL